MKFREVSLACAVLIVCLLYQACATDRRHESLHGWLQRSGCSLDDLTAGRREKSGIEAAFKTASVVALGEATHGQHESFEAKRAITMHLIREHGYRVVAYEASASKARACNAYVSGETDDLAAAMSGFGMLIWQVEENAQLLRDLRQWNASVPAEQRVRFVGVDVQDTDACAARLSQLLEGERPDFAKQVKAIAVRVDEAANQMFAGSRDAYDTLVSESDALCEEIREKSSKDQTRVAVMECVLEFQRGVARYKTVGARDRAMADLLLQYMKSNGEDKVVVWAHSAHVAKGALRYLNSEELAMGGHVATAIGKQYVAVGVAFGEGSFASLDRGESGKWGFRKYQVESPPIGSFEQPLAQEIATSTLIDLHEPSSDPTVKDWIRGDRGLRWFGGYNVPADVREMTRDVKNLMVTDLDGDFDMLLFLPKTTASVPRNPSLVLPAIAP